MPDRPRPPDWRVRLHPYLFWAGVGLAPLAALLLLVGQSSAILRIAAVFGIFSVVCIGAAVVLRNDTDTARGDVESLVLDEVDALREEVRDDIVAVARKLHAALRGEVADLAGHLEDLHMQVTGRPLPAPPDVPPDARPAGRSAGGERRPGPLPPDEAEHGAGHGAGHGGGHGSGHGAQHGAPAARGGGQQSGRFDAAAGFRGRPPPDQPPGPPAGRRPPRQRTPYGAGGDQPSEQYGDELVDWTSNLAGGPQDTGEDPVSGGPSASGRRAAGRSWGRRRAAEPERPAPVAAIESGRRPTDPWADLRGGADSGEQWGDADGYPGSGYDGPDSEGRDYAGPGYDGPGYDGPGYDSPDYDGAGYDPRALDGTGGYDQGYDSRSYDAQSFDAQGFDAQGFDAQGFDARNYDGPDYDNDYRYGQGYDDLHDEYGRPPGPPLDEEATMHARWRDPYR